MNLKKSDFLHCIKDQLDKKTQDFLETLISLKW